MQRDMEWYLFIVYILLMLFFAKVENRRVARVALTSFRTFIKFGAALAFLLQLTENTFCFDVTFKLNLIKAQLVILVSVYVYVLYVKGKVLFHIANF